MTKDNVIEFIEKNKKQTKINTEQILKEAEYEKYGLRNILHIIRRMESELQRVCQEKCVSCQKFYKN